MRRIINLCQRVMYVFDNQRERDDHNNVQDARTLLPQLTSLVNSKLKILIWVRSRVDVNAVL